MYDVLSHFLNNSLKRITKTYKWIVAAVTIGEDGDVNMSCIVMYQPYPPSSYLLPPTGPPPGPSNHSSHHQLPSLSSGGFDRGLPSTTNSSQLTSAAVVATTSPVISPHSPATQQQHPRLPPSTNNNGLVQQNSIIEPKLEKVSYYLYRHRGWYRMYLTNTYEYVTLSLSDVDWLGSIAIELFCEIL